MAEDLVERHLAAILAADVVGYSRLMEANEERTMAALKHHRRELFDPTMAKHGGRIFNDTDFDPLHGHPRWQTVVDMAT